MKTVGDGTRTLNFFIDTILIFIIVFFVYKGWNFQVKYWKYPSFNFGWFFFGILFIYYTLFESLFARTPGKWFTSSKVVTKEGKKPGLLKVLLRSIVRLTLIDLFFLPFLGMTLHDYISKTSVVEN